MRSLEEIRSINNNRETYRIVRFFKYSGDREVKETGYTLTAAQTWCNDPASRDEVNGWFDGYEVEG